MSSRLVYGALPAEPAAQPPTETVFEWLRRVTPFLNGAERARLFAALPAWLQDLAWHEVAGAAGEAQR